MALFNLSSADLARLISLVKEKESLQAKLDRVDATLRSLETGKPAGKRRGRKPGRPAGAAKEKKGKARRARGKRLKAPLLRALSKAGSSGITVRDLAAKLKVKPGNIFSWFYTTGKKIGGIKKVGEARYAFSSQK